jgi:hypothetical protein
MTQTLQIKVGRLLFHFDDFQNWVNSARRKFEKCRVVGIRDREEIVCLDSAGRICRSGREFQRARDEGAFPVNCYAINPSNDFPYECPGHGRGGTKAACCSRAGEYNGFASDGPLSFICPKQCSCHD